MSSPSAFISVVVPALNEASRIEATLASVHAQTGPFEVVAWRILLSLVFCAILLTVTQHIFKQAIDGLIAR